MYIPGLNKIESEQEKVDFIKRYSFGTLITCIDNIPVATHLPFSILAQDQNIILESHFARNNNQWQSLDLGLVLVIFSEPHSFISPKHYEKELEVPTWNYIAVHAYGKASLITDQDKIFQQLETMIDTFDHEYKKQWNQFPDQFKLKMSQGIVAFSVKVDELQGKKKLSQNKTLQERENIMSYLEAHGNGVEKDLAAFMRKEAEVKK